MNQWDETDILKFSVEELIEGIKTTWIAKSIGYDYEHRVDFEEEVCGESWETAVDLMLDKLVVYGAAEEIFVKRCHTLQIPLIDAEGIWWFKEFTHIEEVSGLNRWDVENHPTWKAKVVKANEEKAAAEKAKREAEQKQWKEDTRKRDLATYERIKKELENGNA